MKIRLGECFAISNKKLGDELTDPPILSLSKYRGVVLAEEYFDKRIASESLAGYKVLEENQWAYSTIHIDEGLSAGTTLALAEF